MSMKKLILLLPLFTLSACSFESSANYGQEINREEAQFILNDLFEESQKPTNYVIDCSYSYSYREINGSNNFQNIKSSFRLEMTSEGYTHVKYSGVSKDEEETANFSLDYYYGVTGNQEVTFIREKYIEGDSETKAFHGYEEIPNYYEEIETALQFVPLDFSLKDIGTLAQSVQEEEVASNPGEKESLIIKLASYYNTTYYSNNETSLAVVTNMPETNINDNVTVLGKGEVVFENSRMKKYTMKYNHKYGQCKLTEETKISFSYPSNLKITLPSDWTRYIVK